MRGPATTAAAVTSAAVASRTIFGVKFDDRLPGTGIAYERPVPLL